MYPKVRNPILVWFLAIATLGLYIIYWGYTVSKELNFAEEKTVLAVDRWRKMFFSLVGFILIGILIVKISGVGMPVIIAFFLANIFYVYVQISIGNYIIKKQKELNLSETYWHAISFGLMYFFFSAGISYMQYCINEIIEVERAGEIV